MSTKKLIVVLGMHRSGTSAITRALKVFGAEFGDNLMKPVAQVNDKGFWEDEDIYLFNEEMLSSINQRWYSIKPLTSADFNQIEKAGYLVKAVNLLRQKLADYSLYALKDPRISILLPFWRKVFAHCNLDVYYVMAIRNPMSVVASLSKRDGFEPVKTYYLWLLYTYAILSTLTETDAALLVEYDRFLDQPDDFFNRAAEGFNLSIITSEKKSYEQSFLDKTLRHSQFYQSDLDIDPNCPVIVRQMYQTLVDTTDALQPILSLKEHILHWKTVLSHQLPLLAYAEDLSVANMQAKVRLQTQASCIAEQERRIAEQEGRIAEQEGRIAEQEKRILVQQDLILQHQKQLNELLQSRSWRYTAFLRKINAWLRK